MNSIYILFSITLCFVTARGQGLCPAPYIDISPCICVDNLTEAKLSAIQCFGEETIDLIEIFEILDANIGPKNKNFNTFYLNNTSIEEIPENVFKDITFEEIIIENTSKLSKISQNSFKGLAERVKHLHLKNTKLNLNSQNYSDIQALVDMKSLELLDFSSAECPPSNLLGSKCRCNTIPDFEVENIVGLKSLVIQCSQVANKEELIQVFDALNNQLTGNDRNIYRFQLKESKIEELPENLFKGIAFSEVVIEDSPQLSQIHKNVFKSIEPFVNRLQISNIELKGTNESNTATEDLWYAISTLQNLVSLDLVNVFDEIPNNAFKKVGPQPQWRLKLVSHSGYQAEKLNGHRLQKIGRYAFNNLPNIQIINLQNNLIEKIDKYSFANQISSERRLFIRLARNKLNLNSFSVGSFAGSQRPIKLELGQLFTGCNRDLVYLNESVFSAFLDKPGNQLDMGCAFVMQCDCNMKWLYDGPTFWRNKIKTGAFGETVIPCELENEDGVEEVSIWDLPEEHFECNPNIVYQKQSFESIVNSSENVENEVQEFIDDAIELMA